MRYIPPNYDPIQETPLLVYIDFDEKQIVVSSENGPLSCVIDCEGSPEEDHRGFYFYIF